MGSGLNKSGLAHPIPQGPFSQSTPPRKLSSSHSSKDPKKPSHYKEIADLTTVLLGNKMNSDFKLGKKKKEIISKEQFFNNNHTIDVILNINEQVLALNDNLTTLGYVSEKICKIIQEACQTVKKCFYSKFKVLDLGSEVNTRRVFSILKTVVELYHICKFFKEESVFLEGKWWGNTSESRYISLMKRKISKKCEAITENYEKSASEDEGTPSTSDVSNVCANKKIGIVEPQRSSNSEMRLRMTSENSDPRLSIGDKAKSAPKIVEEKKSLDYNEDEGRREMAEKILKMKKKLDLNLDHIEEMPINFECSSKRIDINEMDFNRILAEGTNNNIDCIKENSDDKIQSKKNTFSSDAHLTENGGNCNNFQVITNLLLEINQIKHCLQENVVTKEEEEESDQTSMQVSHDSKKMGNRENGEKMDKNQRNETKMKRENYNGLRGQSESFDLSEFITNYLNKTYKNVIENST